MNVRVLSLPNFPDRLLVEVAENKWKVLSVREFVSAVVLKGGKDNG